MVTDVFSAQPSFVIIVAVSADAHSWCDVQASSTEGLSLFHRRHHPPVDDEVIRRCC